jgi:hypothetical protein
VRILGKPVATIAARALGAAVRDNFPGSGRRNARGGFDGRETIPLTLTPEDTGVDVERGRARDDELHELTVRGVDHEVPFVRDDGARHP